MNLALNTDHAGARRRRRGVRAFTMIEIAISIGIIGFALVAIIGILPTGLNVQKDNREDSIINQDANFFMQAIRNGAAITNLGGQQYMPYRSLDFLSNYVDAIQVSNTDKTFSYYTNSGNSTTFSGSASGNPYQPVGACILGLLSTPAFYVDDLADYQRTSSTSPPPTNYVRAWVRGLNGSALEQGANQLVAFRYVMDVNITPHCEFPYDETNLLGYDGVSDYPDFAARSNRWVQARCLSRNLYDVQLTFHWPVLSSGSLGPNHQTFRSTIAASLTNYVPSGSSFTNYYYFQPLTYAAMPLQ